MDPRLFRLRGIDKDYFMICQSTAQSVNDLKMIVAHPTPPSRGRIFIFPAHSTLLKFLLNTYLTLDSLQ